MIGNLATALTNLLTSSMPTLVGTGAGQVDLAVAREESVVDPSSADALAGAPRPDDARDTLPFNPATPEGPYTLSQPPYPGPRRVYLENGAGERVTLSADEVLVDPVDAQQFSLALKAHRDVAALDQLTVLYSVTSVFTTLKAFNTVELELTSTDPDNLRAAEAIAIAVIQLNRETLTTAAAASVTEGVYTADTSINSLLISRAETAQPGAVTVFVTAESEVKASRALAEDEGAPIDRIASPGTTPDPGRSVHVEPIVEA